MHVISRKRLNEFAKQHPDTKGSLARWYQLIKRGNFASFVELRTVFPTADQVGKLTVFNVGATNSLNAIVHAVEAVDDKERINKAFFNALLNRNKYPLLLFSSVLALFFL
ncbi:MAG TPA: type II toxin-antitoxin system HigB family toxin, partial [Pyrinomonadaceae bacterium]|nr:type II toxin-antitoxin system HigB family toxin [Pyrinomonadaceae bacterium]